MGLFDFFKTKNEVPYEKIDKELDTFTTASLAMPKMNNPFLMDDQKKHPMIFAYFAGAMNHISTTYDLKEQDKNTIYREFISRNFAHDDVEKTDKLMRYSNDLINIENSKNDILVGELAMKRWKAGGPMAEYAPMALMRLLKA